MSEKNEVSISFSKNPKLYHEFTSKQGKEMLSIKIPAEVKGTQWGQLVVPKDSVKIFDDQKNPDKKGYFYVDADREFKLKASIEIGTKYDGSKIYEDKEFTATAKEISEAVKQANAEYAKSMNAEKEQEEPDLPFEH